MALAPFFDKALQSASVILGGVSADLIRRTLSSSTVAIVIDEGGAASPEGRATFELLADLVARLYPSIHLVALAPGADELVQRAQRRVAEINPLIEISNSVDDPPTIILVVGSTPFAARCPVLYAGSDGWVARVSTATPVGSGSSTLPYGAGVAACIGAANAFRCVFQEHLGQPKLDQDLTLNAVNFSTDASAAPVPTSIGEIDLGETFLIGLGAIGHGAVWALERQAGLHGVFHLIDDEDYDGTNPQRYVGTTHAEVGPKVAALRDRLAEAHRGLQATGHRVAWDEFLSARNDWRLDRVAVAVDSADDRLLIQSSLPRLVLNAWTQRDNVGVSRHEFLSSACLCCLYIPDTQVPDQDDLVAAQLKFGTEEDTVKVVREWIDTGKPMTSELVAQIETQVSVPPGTLAGYVGQPLMSLYQREACGGGILNAGGHLGDGGAAVEVPMAFQSALAGIMLAAEIVCSAAPIRPAGLPTRTEINLLKPIKGTLNSPEAKHGSGRCLCQDPDFVSAYRSKYGLVT
jgi:hypothetical protein